MRSWRCNPLRAAKTKKEHKKNARLLTGVHHCNTQSNRAGNLAGAQAARAGVDPFRRAVYDCFYFFDIGLPGSVGTSVRVRNLDAERDAFAAEFTFRHFKGTYLFSFKKRK